MLSGCFDFFFLQTFLMSLESVTLKCVLAYVHVCISGFFGISAMNMSLVSAVTLQPQTSVCVFKPLCTGFWVREQLVGFVLGRAGHAGLKLFWKWPQLSPAALTRQQGPTDLRGQTLRRGAVALHSCVHNEDLVSKSVRGATSHNSGFCQEVRKAGFCSPCRKGSAWVNL